MMGGGPAWPSAHLQRFVFPLRSSWDRTEAARVFISRAVGFFAPDRTFDAIDDTFDDDCFFAMRNSTLCLTALKIVLDKVPGRGVIPSQADNVIYQEDR